MVSLSTTLTLLPFRNIGSALTNAVDVHDDYNCHVVSAMDDVLSKGVLKGRSFGSVGFLWHKCVSRNIQVLKSDTCGRCLIKLNFESKAILLFNLYLPYFESSADYLSELTFYLGFIDDILEPVSHTDIVILGDTNFPVNMNNFFRDL